MARIEVEAQVELVVSDRRTLSARAYDQVGAEIPGVPIRWVSVNPEVASVNATSGEVTGVAAGEALVIATAEGRADTADVMVSAPETPPGGTPPVEPPPVESPPEQAPSGPIALRVARFVPGSGLALVSNGIPLPPGRLRETDLGKVRIWVEGVEKPLYVEALRGRHPDGSLRSVYVEFEHSLQAPVDGLLTTDTPRTLADRARSSAERGAPVAVALPSSPDYLVSTGMVGRTMTSAQTRALGPNYVKYEDDFVRWADYHWSLSGAAWTENYYDRALIYYAFWMRTGNPEYFYRGTQLALNYRRDYLAPNNYMPSAHWSQIEGVEKHYLFTGDTVSWVAVGRVADLFRLYLERYTGDTTASDARIDSRTLLSFLSAQRIAAPTAQPAAPGWDAQLDGALTKILAAQRADGSWRYKVVCYTSMNYQGGLMNTVLVKYHETYKADARIRPAVTRSVDFLVGQMLDTTLATVVGSFTSIRYLSGECEGVGSTGPAPDLNGLFLDSFRWVGRSTEADALLAGMRAAWLAGTKQFNESYTSSFGYIGYRP